jgi:hypothetical protein
MNIHRSIVFSNPLPYYSGIGLYDIAFGIGFDGSANGEVSTFQARSLLARAGLRIIMGLPPEQEGDGISSDESNLALVMKRPFTPITLHLPI